MKQLFLSLDTADYLFYAGVGALGIFIQALVIRWAVKANESIQNQRTLILLLEKLCEKNGVSLADTFQLTSAIKQKKAKKSFASIFGTPRFPGENNHEEATLQPPKYD